MFRRSLFVIIALLFASLIAAAQNLDDDGNPNDPNVNDRANACYTGGSMENKCDEIWDWSCGWYLIRFEAGIILREDFPNQCSILLPPLPEGETIAVAGIPRLSVGCYDSSGGDFDFYFSGPINQANNLDVYNSTNGGCSGGSAGFPNAMMAYFEGSQADALLYCKSINPAITYIENSLAHGYPVPNAYFWGCA
jgi:hypothetical protein